MLPFTWAAYAIVLFTGVSGITPGTYFISSVGFPNFVITAAGDTPSTAASGAGATLNIFAMTAPPTHKNSIWTIDGNVNSLLHEGTGQFAITDASNGPSAGSGVWLFNTSEPIPPFPPIGNPKWEFVPASNGVFVQLSGSTLVWTILTEAVFTQITMAEADPSDTRQQWIFTPHALI